MAMKSLRAPKPGYEPANWTVIEPMSSIRGLVPAIAAEFLGTLLFVFLATATVASACHVRKAADGTTAEEANVDKCFLHGSNVLSIAISFGLSLFVMVYLTAAISGGHMNPAITFGMFLARRVSLLRGISYVVAQSGGAIVASFILRLLDNTGFKASEGAANQVGTFPDFSRWRVFGYEIVGTFALVFVALAATDRLRHPSGAHLPVLWPLSLGLLLVVLHLILIPIDGCSVNPARSLGPAVVKGKWKDLWIFWAAPLAGGAAAAILYEVIFSGRYIKGHYPKDWEESRRDPTSPDNILPTSSRDSSPIHVAGQPGNIV